MIAEPALYPHPALHCREVADAYSDLRNAMANDFMLVHMPKQVTLEGINVGLSCGLHRLGSHQAAKALANAYEKHTAGHEAPDVYELFENDATETCELSFVLSDVVDGWSRVWADATIDQHITVEVEPGVTDLDATKGTFAIAGEDRQVFATLRRESGRVFIDLELSEVDEKTGWSARGAA